MIQTSLTHFTGNDVMCVQEGKQKQQNQE